MPIYPVPNLEITLYVSGSPVSGALLLQQVEIDRTVNFVPSARITLMDGDPSAEDFEWSGSSSFKLGTEIEVKAGTDAAPVSIFKGIIVGQSIQQQLGEASSLVLECKDKSVKATLNRTFQVYTKKKDSDIISTLASNNGLSATVTATSVQHEQMVQYNATDWDFIVARAEANGMIVTADAGALTVKAPDESASAKATITYGTDVFSFALDVDARRQLKSVTATAWDQAAQALVTGDSSEPSTGGQTTTASSFSSVVAQAAYNLKSPAVEASAELKAWADGLLLKSRLARVQGTVTVYGTTLAMPGDVVELAGFGDVFNGNALVSGLRHILQEGTWTTELSLGLSEQWFARQVDAWDYPASSQLPVASGLHIGTVAKIDSDPNGEFRVQIKNPLLSDSEMVWARQTLNYASSNCGFFFMPEVNDEVVYACLNEDPRSAVIIGSVYSSKNTAPFTPDNKNQNKAIVTKSQIKVTFDDVDKILTLLTPAGNKMTFDDKAGSVTIVDKNSNKIEMASSGITITSCKDLTLTAQGNVSVTSQTGKISLSASAGDVTLEGLNVNATAQIGAAVKGNATAELSASGQTTVKGAIVMIN